MGYPVFYVPAGDVLPVMFDSFAGSTGASITITGLAVTDIEIYKDGSTTQRASDNGYTLLDTDGIDFDAITGIHGFSIDTGDNTDAGFYTVGAWFTVVVSAITVDAQTVSFIACQFRIMPAESIAGKPKVDVDANAGSAITSAAGIQEVKVASIAANAINAAAIAADAITDAKVAADVTIASVTGAVGSVTAGVTVTTNNDKTGYALSATGSAALTEGYPADGATGTLPQLLYLILAFLQEKNIAGTTVTTKKLDGATTAATYTLDSSTAPTTITRAT